MRPAASLARAATALLAAVAICCVPAEAQRGPAPGQDPLGYTVSYAQDQAGQAQSDPVAYAQRTATAEGVANATAEAGYVACWAAYDATQQELPPCAGYFTPPGTAQRPSPDVNATAAPVADEALAQAQNLTATALDAVGQVVEDPSSAPAQAERIVAALGEAVSFVVAAVSELLKGLGGGLASIGAGVGSAAGAAMSGFNAGLAGLSDGAAAVGGAAADAAGSVASLAFTAGQAVGDAAGAVGNAVAAGAGAAGRAIGDAAGAVVQAVASWFGAAPSGHEAAPALAPVAQLPEVEAPSLLDGVVDKVPL